LLLSDSQCVSMLAGIPSSSITGTISLWYTKDANSPTVTAGTNNLFGFCYNRWGFPTCGNGNWVEVTNRNGSQIFNLVAGDTTPIYTFSGWDSINMADSTTATYMAIVVCFNTLTAANYISFEYVGLFSGDIPTEPAPQSTR